MPIPPEASDSAGNLHRQLRRWLREALTGVDVRHVLRRQMSIVEGCLQIGSMTYSLADKRRIVLFAAGKAAVPMCSVAVEILRPALGPTQQFTGIAVGPRTPDALPLEIEYFAGGHPLPDEESLRAARAVRALLEPLEDRDLVLFLISGGASSMLEAPLNPDAGIEEIILFHRALVHSGLPIRQMNTLRKHFSAVKGGRLAALAAPATQCTLIVSDVPGTEFDMVGSGPSMPDPSTVRDCENILRSSSLQTLPGLKLRNYLDEATMQETPKPGDPAFSKSGFLCLLSNEDLLHQVVRQAKDAGFHVEVDNTCDDWDYRDASAYLLEKVRSLRDIQDRVCLLSGGEVSVKVASPGGVGGRNQHLALHTALSLDGTEPYLAMLSAGSDGIDGNSPAAGAIADSFTAARAREAGLNPADALERFDSYRVFEALGDAIVTGPTGNNVRDVRILVSVGKA